jgi:hypothetical protein
MTDIFVCFSFWQRMGYMISGTGLMTELGKQPMSGLKRVFFYILRV